MGYVLDAQGQLTLLSVVQIGQNSNTANIFCISSLPASLKKDRDSSDSTE